MSGQPLKRYLVTDRNETEQAIVQAHTMVSAAYEANLQAWLVNVYELPKAMEWEQVWRVKPS